MFNKNDVTKLSQYKQSEISDKMATAITAWFNEFYLDRSESGPEDHHTHFAQILTSYMSTLATNETIINSGSSARARYIDEQVSRFVMPKLKRDMQLAGVGGEVILKPFVNGKNIYVEVVSADRFYPTRINCAGVAEAGFFTDFDHLNGRKVVRVEQFELAPEGVYLTNKGFYLNDADLIGNAIDLTEVYRWKDLQPELLVKNVDRPLFARIEMPFANTIDNTSRLPVSIYANALDTLHELDRIYSEFLWEIHTGKRKRIVDMTAIRTANPTQQQNAIANKDLATDLYLVLDMGAEPAKPFDDYTPEMRVEAYQKAIDIQVRLLEKQTGFSNGTFTFDIRTGKITATQVISEDMETFNTIKDIQNSGMLQALKDLIYIFDVFATLYNLAPSGEIDPSVTFGDSIFEDTAVEFSRRKQMADGHYLKPEKFVSWYFGVSDEEALKEYMPEPEDDNLFEGE